MNAVKMLLDQKCIFGLEKLKSAEDIKIIVFNPNHFPTECLLLCCCCWSRKGPDYHFELPFIIKTMDAEGKTVKHVEFKDIPGKWYVGSTYITNSLIALLP